MNNYDIEGWLRQPVTKILIIELNKRKEKLRDLLSNGTFLTMDRPLEVISEKIGVVRFIDELLTMKILDNVEIEDDYEDKEGLEGGRSQV